MAAPAHFERAPVQTRRHRAQQTQRFKTNLALGYTTSGTCPSARRTPRLKNLPRHIAAFNGRPTCARVKLLSYTNSTAVLEFVCDALLLRAAAGHLAFIASRCGTALPPTRVAPRCVSHALKTSQKQFPFCGALPHRVTGLHGVDYIKPLKQFSVGGNVWPLCFRLVQSASHTQGVANWPLSCLGQRSVNTPVAPVPVQATEARSLIERLECVKHLSLVF